MNMLLNAIAAKLKNWHLVAESTNAKTIVNEIYKALFAGDFYKEIWDEPILLALGDLTLAHPPNKEVYAQQLQFINERTVLVGCINDLFSLVVLSTNEEPSVTLGRLGDQLGIGQELILLQTNGTLSKIRGSNAHPRKKLEDFVDALKQVPSISDLLTRSFESVQT